MNIQNIAKHFIIAGLWASTDSEGTPFDDAVKYGKARTPKKTLVKVEKFISDFIAANKEVVEKAIEIRGENIFGCDLFLNCAGHGAGFWDRNELAAPSGKTIIYKGEEIEASIGEYLDKACESSRCESFDICRGWIYFN